MLRAGTPAVIAAGEQSKLAGFVVFIHFYLFIIC